jgi:glutamate--cysteine ligase
MYFVYRDGKYIDCAGQSFRDFMQGKLPALMGELPTVTDWANHLTTCFPDVRLKKIIEMRGADEGDFDMMQALPAFWVGLLYDDAVLNAAWDAVKHWTPADRKQLRLNVLRHGLRAEIAGQSVNDVATTLLGLSQQGLRRRNHVVDGRDEAHYLDCLLTITDKKRNRADELLQKFGSGTLDKAGLFKACRLLPNH